MISMPWLLNHCTQYMMGEFYKLGIASMIRCDVLSWNKKLSMANTYKLTEYDPFIPRLRPKGWKVNLLTIETPGVRAKINNLLATPKNAIKHLMKNVH